MKLGDGLFRQTVKDVGQDYPGIGVSDLIVDNASMQAVAKPQQFDVLVTLTCTVLSYPTLVLP